jgi:ABC-type bacteriocin/lantibiotic exporter with double-glycine peptidase domain
MSDLSLLFQNLSFTYYRATQPIIRNLSVHFTPGWTGIVGANGVGKSTILKLATGDLEPGFDFFHGWGGFRDQRAIRC